MDLSECIKDLVNEKQRMVASGVINYTKVDRMNAVEKNDQFVLELDLFKKAVGNAYNELKAKVSRYGDVLQLERLSHMKYAIDREIERTSSNTVEVNYYQQM